MIPVNKDLRHVGHLLGPYGPQGPLTVPVAIFMRGKIRESNEHLSFGWGIGTTAGHVLASDHGYGAVSWSELVKPLLENGNRDGGDPAVEELQMLSDKQSVFATHAQYSVSENMYVANMLRSRTRQTLSEALSDKAPLYETWELLAWKQITPDAEIMCAFTEILQQTSGDKTAEVTNLLRPLERIFSI